MKNNRLIKKRILGVSGQTDVLQMLDEMINGRFSKCRFDSVATAEEAIRAMMFSSFHLLIIDQTNFKKIQHARLYQTHLLPILILIDKGKFPPNQKNSFSPNVYGLPANRPEEIISILPQLLSIEFTPRWQRPFRRFGGIFNLGTVEAAEKLFKNGAMKTN